MSEQRTPEEKRARWEARRAVKRQRVEVRRRRLGVFLLKLHMLWPDGPWLWLYRNVTWRRKP